jgi:hypothetical protein
MKTIEAQSDLPINEALQVSPKTPMEMLAVAVTRGATIDELAKLMDLQERWEKNEARKKFVEAMNAFKTNPPSITKNKTVTYGSGDRATSYSHATLDHVCEAVTKGLSEHGISHRWKVDQDKDSIKVTCILTHDMGHSEETTLYGSPDTSGSKNSIQAIGSTVTYLERYTLLAATGLAAANQDNDAQDAGTNGELQERIDWLGSARNKDELKSLFQDAYRMFETNPTALRALVTAKNARAKEL